MVSVELQNLDFGASGVAWGRPQNEPLSKEANSEPVCLIEAYRGLHGFCEASESRFWRVWGGLALWGTRTNESSAVRTRGTQGIDYSSADPEKRNLRSARLARTSLNLAFTYV